MMKKMIALLLFLLALGAFADQAKYVFLFIGDGFGAGQRTLSECFLKRPLTMNSMEVRVLTGTLNCKNGVTDSAASGTAIACGKKTFNGALGITPEKVPLESIAVKMKKAGRSVALISSSHLTDATPAAHYAHQDSRKKFDAIGLEMAASGFDFFGGAEVKGKNTLAALRSAGYQCEKGADSFSKLKPGKAYVHSQPFTAWTPGEKNGITLAEYLEFAVKRFENNPKGFFVMLENGHTDYAGHFNDSGKMVREALALDAAVAYALGFMKKHPRETLVVVTADHETGNLVFRNLQKDRVPLLSRQKMELSRISDRIRKMSSTGGIVAYLENSLGYSFRPEEKNELLTLLAKKTEVKNLYGQLQGVSLKAAKFRDRSLGFEYTSRGHSGQKIMTTVSGVGSGLFREPLENSDIPRLIEKIALP